MDLNPIALAQSTIEANYRCRERSIRSPVGGATDILRLSLFVRCSVTEMLLLEVKLTQNRDQEELEACYSTCFVVGKEYLTITELFRANRASN